MTNRIDQFNDFFILPDVVDISAVFERGRSATSIPGLIKVFFLKIVCVP
jgi:hypothetical protein